MYALMNLWVTKTGSADDMNLFSCDYDSAGCCCWSCYLWAEGLAILVSYLLLKCLRNISLFALGHFS